MERTKYVVEAAEEIEVAMEQQASATNTLTTMGESFSRAIDFGDRLMQDAEDLAKLVMENMQDAHKNAGATLLGVLAARLADHAAFLHNAVACCGHGNRLKSHTECAFGVWYAAEGQKALGHLASFKGMDAPHRAIHQSAQELADKGTVMAAEQLVAASLDLLRQFLLVRNDIAASVR